MIKKYAHIIIFACTLLLLASCNGYDIDLKSEDNVYDEFAQYIATPDNVVDKTVRVTSTLSAVYNFEQNKINRFVLVEPDSSGEKRALYEIRFDEKCPALGQEVTVNGTFRTGGYIEVDSFSEGIRYSDFDIDTLDMSASELTKMIQDYRKEYRESEYFEKTIRIFGSIATHDSYVYLVGIDGSGSPIWDIELHDPSGMIPFPTSDMFALYPVEIIGKLSIYFEDNIAYACINVESIVKVESTLK
jgi:hypothetical protein